MAAAWAVLAMLTACSPAATPPADNAAQAGQAVADPKLAENAGESPLKAYMGHVMDRNAAQLWAWTTYVSDAQGGRYTQPRTEDDWIDAESDALTMVHLGDLLAMPGLALDDDRWAGQLARFRQAARDSAEAAEAQDFARLEAAASDMNRACVACHVTYVPEIEGPYAAMK